MENRKEILHDFQRWSLCTVSAVKQRLVAYSVDDVIMSSQPVKLQLWIAIR